MSVRIYDSQWREVLVSKPNDDHSCLKLVCPFIKGKALSHIIGKSKTENIQVITRFNLTDFHSGVSDISALESLIECGAKIRGVKNLHAKVYIFGTRRAVVTSANLTWSALTKNSEYGVELADQESVRSCSTYFDSLWKKAGSNLTVQQIEAWKLELRAHTKSGEYQHKPNLPDYGQDLGFAPPADEINANFLSATKHYIKFFATSREREVRETTLVDFIEGSGSHIACTYPKKIRPRRIASGSIMYIAALVDDPRDIIIVGRAIAKAYEDGKDDASDTDIKRRPWKAKWPRYIRVHDPEFVDGVVGNGVSLNRLMDTRQSDLFALTKQHAKTGSGNTDPRRAYLRRPDVELSEEGAIWVRQELEAAFARHGKLAEDEFINIK